MFKILFGSQQFHNDEEYKKFLQARSRMLLLLSLFGVLLITAVNLAVSMKIVVLSDHMAGFFTGAGSGLVGAGLVIFIRNRRIMNNPKLLRKLRIKSSDERNLANANKALRITAFSQFLAGAVLTLFGMLIDPVLTTAGTVLIYLFVIVYAVSYYILDKKF